MNIFTWSVRGLNKPFKQKEVILFLNKNKIDVFGCLETRVRAVKAKGILLNFDKNWYHANNYPYSENGIVWLFWRKHLNAQPL